MNEGVKLIKNEVVQMDWDAEGFYESKKLGFIAAVHQYETEKGIVPVVFMSNKAFLLIDVDTEIPVTRDEVYDGIKESLKAKTAIDELYEDNYVELCNAEGVNETVGSYYALDAEQCKDVFARLQDLSGYWVIIEEDMC